MDLPRNPGRQRMLAYGRYVRERNRYTTNSSVTRMTRRPLVRSPITYTYEHFVSLDPVCVGLTVNELYKSSITDLHTYTTIKTFCSICQDDIQTQEIIRTLSSCGHTYHIHCIDQWLCNNVTCPLCKNDLRDLQQK
jgi:hypothetical protein